MGEIEEDAGKKANFGFPDEPQVMTCGRGGGSQGSWCSRNSTSLEIPVGTHPTLGYPCFGFHSHN